MQVRLAFAVAAHLEPEILIIDEVLAVGDAEFQKKCLGRMNEVARDGRTVLFVSHNLAAVGELCSSGIVLSSGEVTVHAAAADAIATYVRDATRCAPTVVFSSRSGIAATGQSIPGIVEVIDSDGMPASSVLMGDPIRLRIGIESSTRLSRPTVGIGFDDMYGRRILSINSDECRQTLPDLGYSAVVTCEVPAPPLVPGQYSVKLVVRNCQIDCLAVENAAIVTVISNNVLGAATGPRTGVCFAKSQWLVN